MSESAASLQVQQLLELLAVVSSLPDEKSAVQGAVERAAQALEAEVAAVVLDDRVAAAVGFPIGAVPSGDLLAVARRERDWLEVPGLDKCEAVAVRWGGTHPGHLILARGGDEPFSVEERNLVRGMARMLELTLTMLRTLQAEHAMREQFERQAAENARLVKSLRQRQRLLERLSVIQRAISRREPLEQILETVTVAAQDLLGDDVVGLWLRDPEDAERAKLRSSVGLSTKRLPGVPLTEAGAAGEAMRTNSLVVLHGYAHASPVLRELTGGRLCASMAAPVHESGEVCGGLLVASYRPDRQFTEGDEQTLRAFAQNISLALTDSHTFEKMNQAFHDALTGLASRGLFLERMTEQLSTADAEASQVALLFVDLDRFKVVNDSLGHAAGDQLLMITAERIRSELRATDVAGRFGGDEFAVMLRGVTSVNEAVAVAERIVQALSDPMIIAGRKLNVNASIGIALSCDGAADAADLMRRADIAMYQAKRHGRGRYEIFTEEMLLAFAKGGTAG
jgi:diguanylate cyclase (GGDEF)-like protein